MTLEGGSIVRFRELIRKEIQKQLRKVDQVELGVVVRADPEADDIEVQLDSMTQPIPVMWGAPIAAELAQRVVVIAKMGGQEWVVVSVVNPLGIIFKGMEVVEWSGLSGFFQVYRDQFPGMRGLKAYVWGSGGAGGGATAIGVDGESSFGAGGGGGGFVHAWIPEERFLADYVQLRAGSGGIPVTGDDGFAGTDSEFRMGSAGMQLVAGGGGGGRTYEASTTLAGWNDTFGGSTGVGGDVTGVAPFVARGRVGGGGMRPGGNQAMSGFGGDAPYAGGAGGPGRSTIFGQQAGVGGQFPGGGGSGASTNHTSHVAQPGGAGARGKVRLEVYV